MGDFEKGAVLDGRYEILGVLGSGGMGCVYKARQLHLDRMVAIKIPSASIQENTEFLARFIREARACAKIAHDHIVAIYDVHSGERPYIVMEYVDGMPLHHYLHEQATALFVSDLLDIIGQICDGLAEAHARGVVHRDIKPANIVITRNAQRVKIMDFGIARISEETGITISGSLMGTPYYMAPEQIRGLETGPATDLYALAAMVYQLFTGRQVFEGNISSLVYKHVHEQPKRPSSVNSALPELFDAVLLQALSKKPESRQGSTVEFCRELRMALRSLMNLPFSQIFAPPPDNGDASALNSIPTKPTPRPAPEVSPSPANAARSTMPVDPYAPTMQVAPGVEPLGGQPTTRTAAEIHPKADETGFSRRRSKSRILIIAFAVIAIAAVGALLAIHRNHDRPDAAANQNFRTRPDGAGATVLPAAAGMPDDKALRPGQPDKPSNAPLSADTSPAPATGANPFELQWVRAPLPEYRAEEVLLVMWKALPPPSAAQRPFYRLSLRQQKPGEKEIWRSQTRENRWAFPMRAPGDYLLRVELAHQTPGAGSVLETPIRVVP